MVSLSYARLCADAVQGEWETHKDEQKFTLKDRGKCLLTELEHPWPSLAIPGCQCME